MEANRIKTRFPKLQVVVLTAALPEKAIVMVDKDWLSTNFWEALILR